VVAGGEVSVAVEGGDLGVLLEASLNPFRIIDDLTQKAGRFSLTSCPKVLG